MGRVPWRTLGKTVRNSLKSSRTDVFNVESCSFNYLTAPQSFSARSVHVAVGEEEKGREEVDPKMTNFGFTSVPEEEKSKLVGKVFENVAEKYDVMNDLMSGGMHRLWKDRLVAKLAPFPGMRHLDVAGGTGDVAFRVVESILQKKQKMGKRTKPISGVWGEEEGLGVTRVTVCDINPSMLEVGKKRAIARGWGQLAMLDWLEGDAECLPLPPSSVDGYTVAFGIRNVTRVDAALRDAYRVLKPGGRFLCLELSHVEDPLFRRFYDLYSFGIIPSVGEAVTGDRDSYQYLVESIRKFPEQRRFASMMSDAGFKNVKFENLFGGVVAIHSGFKF